jgi:carbohydrate kinase (thermoresistant glucokinase family)/Cof subfamily protein (haloacid dehalogenase superfamily)
MMPCALIVMGVSGSGKTTIGERLAARLGWPYEDADQFHPASNVAKMSAGHPLTDEDRWPWLKAIAAEIDRVREAGGRVVIGCSALKRAYRDILVHGRKDIRIVYLDGTEALIAERLGRRKGHFMPPGLLTSQFNTLEPPAPDEHPLTVSIDAPVETIVDTIVRRLEIASRMTRIALVVSDVDGTLLTRDKRLTEAAGAAVRRLHEAGIGFTITSSRPAIGMGFLVEPLEITLPIGPFNGSSIVAPDMKPIEQHFIPVSAVKRSLELLRQSCIDIWLFTNEHWFTKNGSGDYVPNEKRAIRADPTVIDDFAPYLTQACKVVGSSSDFALLARCEADMRKALGAEATAVRSQDYYLDITPPGQNKGTFVQAMARRLGISTDAIATIGDMHNDVAMFEASGLSFAMGNASDEVKKHARRVTASNEEDGFAKAMEVILKESS